MAYQVLARKWRPQQFSALVGQEHVVRALNNALDQDRLHHAYLFTGTRGVGKTTLARIFAKSLNCDLGVTSTPCGQCSACQEIEQGHFVDLIEVDAASRTKVEDTREILENVQYRPSRGRYKVYLIDEVHMLSRHSFNALLKTLEEPPAHVKFLLATTDPQKLPVTILSRCLQFNLKSLGQEAIQNHLAQVLGQEQVPFEDTALALLAKAAKGSMRDALSLTDQAIAHGSGALRMDEVQQMLGTLDTRFAEHLVSAVLADDAQALLAALDELAPLSPDYQALLGDILTLLHQMAVAQQVPGTQGEAAERLAGHVSPQQLQLYYQMAVHGRRDFPYCPDPRMALEMTLLRMLAFSRQEAPAQQQSPAPASRPPLMPKPDIKAEPKSRPAPVATPVQDLEPVTAKAVAPAPVVEPEALAPKAAPEPVVAAQAVEAPELEAQQEQILAMAQAQGYQPAEAPAQPVAPQEQVPPEPEVHEPTPQGAAEASPAGSATQAVLQAQFMLRSQRRQGGQEEAQPLKKPQPTTNPAAEPGTRPVVRPAAQDKPPLDDEPPPWLDDDEASPWQEPPEPAAPAAERPQVAMMPEPVAAAAEPAAPEPAPPAAPAAMPAQSREARRQAFEQYPGVIQALAATADNDRDWYHASRALQLGGLAKQLAMNSVLVKEGERWQLLLTPAQKHLASERQRQELESALREAGLYDGELQVTVAEAKGETPLAIIERIKASCLSYANQVLADDPVARQLLNEFDAELDVDTVRPVLNN
ncbi:DNA polymerase III subunit gamma/tau [Gallaecimonas sp. GXIMD4217]|uniref:DNA polymerase III subunit gamma/tau n=1 Tax=Gallaecimonas sp. GXIMD4217 TaxID=3131927 RepID=UPI00311B1361